MTKHLLCLLCTLLSGLVQGSLVGAGDVPVELQRWFGAQTWDKDTDAPIVSLGEEGQFDDMHIFAPAVANEGARFLMWYCGSRGSRTERVFRLGLATSDDGKSFERYSSNPVYEFSDGVTSVLTPTVLRNPNGTTLREDGKIRMWHSAANFKVGLHTLHEATSADGIEWTEPSAPLVEHGYCPTVIKTDRGYEMWYADVSKRPWVIRHALSPDGTKWQVNPAPVLGLSQPWEAEILVYPTVVRVDGAYLMWYGSYYSAVRRQTTAIGFAASTDGVHWHKHPHNPVMVPDESRLWESNYVGSGCVMQLADGSFRYWYASRTKPPFNHLYFAINTARWAGVGTTSTDPAAQSDNAEIQAGSSDVYANPLVLPPKKGAVGMLQSRTASPQHQGPAVDVLEITDSQNAIVRAWYELDGDASTDQTGDSRVTFVDVWLHGVDTHNWLAGGSVVLSQTFRATGNYTFSTDCGGRSVPRLEAIDPGASPPNEPPSGDSK